jgi:hypothetical protein
VAREHPEIAAELLGSADAIWEIIDAQLQSYELDQLNQTRSQLGGSLPTHLLTAAQKRGRARVESDPASFGLPATDSEASWEREVAES